MSISKYEFARKRRRRRRKKREILQTNWDPADGLHPDRINYNVLISQRTWEANPHWTPFMTTFDDSFQEGIKLSPMRKVNALNMRKMYKINGCKSKINGDENG